MAFNFSLNFRRTIDYIKKNGKDYLKTDFKYLLLLLSGSFILLLLLLAYLLIPSTNNSYLLIYLILGVFFFWMLILVYFNTWLVSSKAVHILKLYQQSETSYKLVLNETKSKRLRLFFGTLLVGFITAVPVLVLYGFYAFGTFLFIYPHPIYENLVPFIILSAFYFFGTLIIAYLLIPLSLYPTVLLIENEKGYFESIKRSYQLLRGWKTKLKFYLSISLISYLVTFVLYFLMIGVLFFALFVLLFFSVSLHLDILSMGLIIIVVVIFLGMFFIGSIIEAQSIGLGTLYGHVYVNLAYPDLHKKKTEIKLFNGKKTLFCQNCGQSIVPDANFCMNCGQKIK